jgi:hypothetical protein
MRLIGEIKLLLNDEGSLYSPSSLEEVFSETTRKWGSRKHGGIWAEKEGQDMAPDSLALSLSQRG